MCFTLYNFGLHYLRIAAMLWSTSISDLMLPNFPLNSRYEFVSETQLSAIELFNFKKSNFKFAFVHILNCQLV